MYRWTGSRLALAAVLAALGFTLNGSPASAMSLISHLHLPQGRTFDTQVELQGLYDELSQVYYPALTREDVHLFDGILYTPNWVLVDASGRKHTLAQLNAREAREPEPDAVDERIEKLTPSPGGVTALVTSVTVRTVPDAEGRYGPVGASHTISAVTPYEDTWVRVAGQWKMESRVQVGPTATVVDKPEWDM